MTLNDLLILQRIAPQKVLALRNRPHESGIMKELPLLAGDEPAACKVPRSELDSERHSGREGWAQAGARGPVIQGRSILPPRVVRLHLTLSEIRYAAFQGVS